MPDPVVPTYPCPACGVEMRGGVKNLRWVNEAVRDSRATPPRHLLQMEVEYVCLNVACPEAALPVKTRGD